MSGDQSSGILADPGLWSGQKLIEEYLQLIFGRTGGQVEALVKASPAQVIPVFTHWIAAQGQIPARAHFWAGLATARAVWAWSAGWIWPGQA